MTIVSRNYLAHARTLAQSYRVHHPQHDFIIVLVDEVDGTEPFIDDGVELLPAADLQLPWFSTFILRYSIMELNTAVKPFALEYLFAQRGYDTLVYLDPDIVVYSPLEHVHAALETADLVLTPHIARPYFDSGFPNDIDILRSGTYNLGFIGLRNAPDARRFVEWWMGKLHLDCVVDLPEGLFVDQKWVDLAPALVRRHVILHHPGYNTAYWNLHDRTLERSRSGVTVDGEPLAFFHYSGYSPLRPHILSKHQNRHTLADFPVLAELTDDYAARLMANGFEHARGLRYGFSRLPNGVALPMDLVRSIVQHALRNGCALPDPQEEPDAFCTFLTTPGSLPGIVIAPLHHYLLKRRSDLAAAFPAAWTDPNEPKLAEWIRGDVGEKDSESLTDLLPWIDAAQISAIGPNAPIHDHVADAFERLREAGRVDVLETFRDMWESRERFERFAAWFTDYGQDEMGFTPEHTAALLAAYEDVTRILNIYFLRRDLQQTFTALERPEVVERFCAWLNGKRTEYGLLPPSISLFREFVLARRELIARARLFYAHLGRDFSLTANVYDLAERLRTLEARLPVGETCRWMLEECPISPLSHYLAHRRGQPTTRRAADNFASLTVPHAPEAANHRFVEELMRSLSDRFSESAHLDRPAALDWTASCNVAGHMSAATGVGEASRAHLKVLEAMFREPSVTTLANPMTQSEVPTHPLMFGWPEPEADISVCVANADTTPQLRAQLPAHFWGRTSVGCWVWETETMPSVHHDADSLYDLILAPSTHAATAIAQATTRPVKVLPYALDLAAIDAAEADRARFGLPTDKVLYGFFFHPASVLERKNVKGLLEAFAHGFCGRDDAMLVLKVNNGQRGNFEYERLRAAADALDNVIIIDRTLSRSDTFAFMKSLDVYVSLHRAEGFGLTCAEAMAAGIPVVASGYSGNMDFMSPRNSILVTTPTVTTDRRYGAYAPGTRWGAPDIEEAAAGMRRLLSAEERRRLGAAGAASVRPRLAPAAVARLAAEHLGLAAGTPARAGAASALAGEAPPAVRSSRANRLGV